VQRPIIADHCLENPDYENTNRWRADFTTKLTFGFLL
jgi:hypothetical protein